MVSVIIPTYNRANLIGDTLNSVLAQSYQNWECIIVDDGSTDHTDEVVQSYIKKDKRFKYYHRPIEHQPGGNGARNYGFKKSKGEYIQWFDSDDLMLKDKIEKKIDYIQSADYDFVISKTKYFNKPIIDKKKESYNYNFKIQDVDFLSYATSNINWFTPDIFLKREIAEKIQFNERLKAGQEYNFSCKLLLHTQNLVILDEYLTLRRWHLDTIGKKRQQDKKLYWKTNFNLHWYNYLELNENYQIPEKFKKYALLKCILSYFNCKEVILSPKFHQNLFFVFKGKAICFYLGIISKSVINRYYFFYNLLK